MLLQVITAIDGFTKVVEGGGGGGAFLLFDGRFAVVLLECSFVGEESGTPLLFVFGSFYQTFHRLLNMSHFPVSRPRHSFELIIG